MLDIIINSVHCNTCLLVLSLPIFSICCLILQQGFSNWLKQRDLRKRSPKLPIVPNVSIWTGNMLELIKTKYKLEVWDKWHRKLGPTFAYFYGGQAWVTSCDPDLIKLVFVEQGGKHINRTTSQSLFSMLRDGIWEAKDQDWARIRRVFASALTGRRVKSVEVSIDIEKTAERLVAGLTRRINEIEENLESGCDNGLIIEAHDYSDRYTLGAIFSILFRRDDEIRFDVEHDDWIEDISHSSRHVLNPILCLGIIFPAFRAPLEFLHKRFLRCGITAEKFCKFVIEASRPMKSPESDSVKFEQPRKRLIDYIIQEGIGKRQLTKSEFVSSTVFLQIAGFETTAINITYLVWVLACRPELQERLRSELAGSRGIDSDYVTWCIMESTRFTVPEGVAAGKILESDLICPNSGILIPKGCAMEISNPTIHRDPSLWPDPDEFKPERWANTKGWHPAAYSGFGLGPHNCVGKALAIQLIRVFLGTVLAHFQLEVCSQTPTEFEFVMPSMFYMLPRNPVMVRLRRLDKKLIRT